MNTSNVEFFGLEYQTVYCIQRIINYSYWNRMVLISRTNHSREELFSLSSGLSPIPVLAMASHESRRYGVAPNAMDDTKIKS